MKNYFKSSVREEYVSPALEVIEIAVEGAICQASGMDAEDWGEGLEDWFN